MNWQVVKALVVKDVTLFMRNQFFAFVSVLGVGAWAAIYILMPKSVDELLEIGLYAPSLPAAFTAQMAEEGMVLHEVESEAALTQAMEDGDYAVGIALPAGFSEALARGDRPGATIYFAGDVPNDLREAYAILLEELAFLLAGQPLHIEATEEILGRDMAGQQIPARERLRPLFAIMVLMVETMGLASLISAEIEAGTHQALLVTPLKVEGLFLGKGITGVGLAFVQATALLALTGGLSQHPALILLALFLGAILVTGIAFLLASAARDMMGVLALGMLAVLLLSVPSFSVLFPGTVSGWIKVLPSHHLVNIVHQAASYGAGWEASWPNLLALLGFDVAIVALGITVLKRKLV
jgi:ABC-2 type transport system permease protein